MAGDSISQAVADPPGKHATYRYDRSIVTTTAAIIFILAVPYSFRRVSVRFQESKHFQFVEAQWKP